MQTQCEKLPISVFYEVIEHETISKSSLWWSAVVLVKIGKKKKIGLYLWQKKDKQWKRKHKFTISSEEQYKDIKRVLEKYSRLL